jgi:hypothetical protein
MKELKSLSLIYFGAIGKYILRVVGFGGAADRTLRKREG